ncbi:hypothetical protein ENBRE01_3116 [Enteropsectra breve]|nr:hypothetical protein ENBRE01_3116 [Enteropsectra breve]
MIGKIENKFHELAVKEICFPNSTEYESLLNGFSATSGIEGAILAIDGTQIKLCRPALDNPYDFYDRKGCFSVTFVCVVDHLQRFRGIIYGFGKCQDIQRF